MKRLEKDSGTRKQKSPERPETNRRRLERMLRQMLAADFAMPMGAERIGPPYRRIIE